LIRLVRIAGEPVAGSSTWPGDVASRSSRPGEPGDPQRRARGAIAAADEAAPQRAHSASPRSRAAATRRRRSRCRLREGRSRCMTRTPSSALPTCRSPGDTGELPGLRGSRTRRGAASGWHQGRQPARHDRQWTGLLRIRTRPEAGPGRGRPDLRRRGGTSRVRQLQRAERLALVIASGSRDNSPGGTERCGPRERSAPGKPKGFRTAR
jgi:hypothetical protein